MYLVAAAALLCLVYPRQNAWLPPCPFHALTGFDCPGCGSTRALRALLHGRWMEAIGFNALFIPGLLMLGIGYAQRFGGKARLLWQRINRPKIVLIAVIAFWILRNLPWMPFAWLSASH